MVVLHNNKDKFDYGPTVVLEHNVNSEIKFYTLYGHLSEKCLKKLSIGNKIKGGDEFAEIGNFPINGNWSPHLHFQIIVDLMNEKKNFPGVAEKNLWSMWSKISPNPNLIFKIPIPTIIFVIVSVYEVKQVIGSLPFFFKILLIVIFRIVRY